PLALETLELEVPEVLLRLVLEVLISGVLELTGLVVLGAQEVEEMELETLRSLVALELERETLEVLCLAGLVLEVLQMLRRDCLPARSLSPHSRCESGLLDAHAFGVELPKLEPLPLETLRSLEVLELEELELGALALVALEQELLTLELEVEVLEIVALKLELETLEHLTLELEVLCLAVLVLEALCGRDGTSFLVSRLLLAFLLPSCVHRLTNHSRRYSQPPHCLSLLPTLCQEN
ncbi:unnamed protein product, partial [Closterium sp. NIES-54]